MQDEPTFKGGEPEPSPDDLLTIPQIARMYGIKEGSARLWKLKPAAIIPYGPKAKIKLFRRADVEAYANSERRQNRLRGQKLRPY